MAKSDESIDDEIIRERVRKVLADGSPRNALAATLRHPLTAIAVGFALTGVLGSRLQQRIEDSKIAAETREHRRNTALAVADSVGFRLNRIYYRAGSYYDAVRKKADRTGVPDSVLRARFEMLSDAQADFESHEFVDRARVRVHLGADASAKYAVVADSLHWIRVYLRKLEAGSMPIDTAAAHILHLRDVLSRFALAMVQNAAEVDATALSPHEITLLNRSTVAAESMSTPKSKFVR